MGAVIYWNMQTHMEMQKVMKVNSWYEYRQSSTQPELFSGKSLGISSSGFEE